MQTGNLKSCTTEYKKDKYWWVKWLNPLTYLPHRLYKEFLAAYIGKPRVATYYYFHTYPENYDLPLTSAVKVKEIKPCKPEIKELELEPSMGRCRSLDFASVKVETKTAIHFDYKIKWILLNFKRILQKKMLNIKLWRKPKIRSFLNFDLKTRLTKKLIPQELFQIKNFVDSKAELIDIIPYTKSFSIGELYEIPIEKPAMNKSFLSLTLLDKFKNHVAAIAKAKPTEIRIVGAFENMYIELYKDIKHNAQKNVLMCYLDENKIHIQNPKKFYLVFGQRMSDKKLFTIVCEN